MIDDAGRFLPSDIIVDADIRFPIALGQCAFLSSLSVSSTLVSLTLLATNDLDAPNQEFTPLAVLSVKRSSDNYFRLLPIVPYAEGVAGWVVVGPIDETYDGRFSTARQATLVPKCAKPYRPSPVRAVSKPGISNRLIGAVKLANGNDFDIKPADRLIDGEMRRVIVFSLRNSDGRSNPLATYRGPCGNRPESGTCSVPGIESINSAVPNCNGNIDIEVEGPIILEPRAIGGIDLASQLGLGVVCRGEVIPDGSNKTTSTCDDPISSTPTDNIGSLGEGNIVTNIVSSMVGLPCPPLPYTETFDSFSYPNIDIVSGEFELLFASETATPPFTVAPGEPSIPGSFVFESRSSLKRNVAVLDICGLASTLNKRVETSLQITSGGAAINGGLILGYKTLLHDFSRDVYFTFALDQDRDSARFVYWDGVNFQNAGHVDGLGLKVGDWYKLAVEIEAETDNVTTLRGSVSGLSDPSVSGNLVIQTALFAPDYGRFGIGTDRAQTRFAYFTLGELS